MGAGGAVTYPLTRHDYEKYPLHAFEAIFVPMKSLGKKDLLKRFFGVSSCGARIIISE